MTAAEKLRVNTKHNIGACLEQLGHSSPNPMETPNLAQVDFACKWWSVTQLTRHRCKRLDSSGDMYLRSKLTRQLCIQPSRNAISNWHRTDACVGVTPGTMLEYAPPRSTEKLRSRARCSPHRTDCTMRTCGRRCPEMGVGNRTVQRVSSSILVRMAQQNTSDHLPVPSIMKNNVA